MPGAGARREPGGPIEGRTAPGFGGTDPGPPSSGDDHPAGSSTVGKPRSVLNPTVAMSSRRHGDKSPREREYGGVCGPAHNRTGRVPERPRPIRGADSAETAEGPSPPPSGGPDSSRRP